MFEKALIAEDQSTIGHSLRELLTKNQLVREAFVTHYCDDAFFKIRAELAKGQGYDLLITDLSFMEDGRPQKLKSGSVLIAAVRSLGIDIKIIVISVEIRIAPIRELFDSFGIDGYVEKGRNDINALLSAIKVVEGGQVYQSAEIMNRLKKNRTILEISNYQSLILKLAAEGNSNAQISDHLKRKGYGASSLRSVEHHFNELRTIFQAKSTAQLIATAKDIGLI